MSGVIIYKYLTYLKLSKMQRNELRMWGVGKNKIQPVAKRSTISMDRGKVLVIKMSTHLKGNDV